MKLKILPVICVFALVGGIIAASNTRFWDSKRIEKSVAANISKGDSETKVLVWLSASSISSTRVSNTDVKFERRQEVKDSKLNPKNIGSVVVGKSKQGFFPDDLHYTQVYFYFDRRRRLIEYDILSSYAGM